jgi:ornithine carbamoyltransferase
MTIRHFTDLSAVPATELRGMLDDAARRKARLKAGERSRPLEGKVLAMIFDKPSTRTRVSFDVGMRQLGGETIMLTGTEMQLGRSETIADTAKVLSRYVDAIMIRTTSHERLLELTENAGVPVINGLTDDTHPCQLMADIMTFEEHRGSVAGKTFAWVGDGNNVLHSLLEASARFRFNLNVAVPEGSAPEQKYIDWARTNGGSVTFTKSAEEAADGADCIVTDCWVSMGQEHRCLLTHLTLPTKLEVYISVVAV